MPPKVYFAKINELEKISGLIPELPGKLGVKVHFGEENNVTYIPAGTIKPLIEKTKNPTLIETTVLYKSQRSRAGTHKALAIKHGFDFAPIDILDGEEGDDIIEKEIESEHFKTCFLGKGIDKYDSLLVISHFKGHTEAGFGGAIKNLGMGLAGRRGKLAQHASIQHQANPDKCISCGLCVSDCPVSAISFDENQKAKIDENICISCSKCISVCPSAAIGIPWESTNKKIFQERMTDYAKAAYSGKKGFFVNFLVSITALCDCQRKKMEIITPDIGILAGEDPVAVDSACYDLLTEALPEFKNTHGGEEQLIYGEKIGLGQRQYELVKI